jgi:hypothetical protein
MPVIYGYLVASGLLGMCLGAILREMLSGK